MTTIYRVEVATRERANDAEGRAVCHDLQEYGLAGVEAVDAVRVYAFAGDFGPDEAERAARELLADGVVDRYAVNTPVLDDEGDGLPVEVRRRTGVMDPAEQSIRKGLRELGLTPAWVHRGRKFVVRGAVTAEALEEAALRILANEVIEEVAVGHAVETLEPASASYTFEKRLMPLDGLDDEALLKLSTDGQLYLSLPEMKTIQQYFADRGRAPTDIELETLAQTWSEHCVHKTFRGKIRYREEGGQEEVIDNLLKSTVARATYELSKPWCWSVFVDNAGVIDFDGEFGAVFKAETHNHPSAIEPYGGAGTGIGGVIRDPLGTGLGAKPVMNTDVFCFGPPDLPREKVPRGALHPRRVMKGVVAGVRDYGNRMGIPTANGAVCFDERYVGNPLVFCGNVALVPKDLAKKRTPTPGQLGIVVGGRTGRDGIHGATFSSVELDEDSEMVSSGAVQIGNPIEEKKVLDFLLRARDEGLYTCITDCGAGGLSSALGEMGETCGVDVALETIPLKYEGLGYTEIWISEAQERMVIAADEEKLGRLRELADEESVEITPIARFTDDGELRLTYDGVEVGRLEMAFLHDGVPQIERQAVWAAPKNHEPMLPQMSDYTETLTQILGGYDVCSKEWIIRQYDHEVQGGSVVKPLVGAMHDGPGDGAVIAPRLGSRRGLAVACGICPRYSDIDPYHMAACAIDESLRNIVAVGGSLARCAILDNFCWGNCDKPDRLGGLVRAAKACYDVAVAYGVPFISGKDSLNNEFGVGDSSICIPGTLLVSAMAVMDDVTTAITMDAKQAGNRIYAVGITKAELGGSQLFALQNEIGNAVPVVDTEVGRKVFAGVSAATNRGLVRAAHDCSDGGLAAAAAEMAFSGNLGLDLDLGLAPRQGDLAPAELLFSESPSRLLLEVEPGRADAFEALLREHETPFAPVGEVIAPPRLRLRSGETTLVEETIDIFKQAWQAPLAW